jgi:hypothetical protein
MGVASQLVDRVGDVRASKQEIEKRADQCTVVLVLHEDALLAPEG